MAAPESSRKRLYNTDEAVFAIRADDDSDNETFEEETVDEDSSSSENDENQVPAPIAAPVRGAPVRRIRTRRGHQSHLQRIFLNYFSMRHFMNI